MGNSCEMEMAPGADSPSRAAGHDPEYICPNCGCRMPMPESGGLHCRNCARYLPTLEQTQRVLDAISSGTPVACHHCQAEVPAKSVCSRCGGRLL